MVPTLVEKVPGYSLVGRVSENPPPLLVDDIGSPVAVVPVGVKTGGPGRSGAPDEGGNDDVGRCVPSGGNSLAGKVPRPKR